MFVSDKSCQQVLEKRNWRRRKCGATYQGRRHHQKGISFSYKYRIQIQNANTEYKCIIQIQNTNTEELEEESVERLIRGDAIIKRASHLIQIQNTNTEYKNRIQIQELEEESVKRLIRGDAIIKRSSHLILSSLTHTL